MAIWYPGSNLAYKPENTLTHNFVNCIKHETKNNFLFMEYVNLTKNINNIRKTETKRGEQKWHLKIRRTKSTNKKKSNSEIRTTDVTTKRTTHITARSHQTLQNATQKLYEKLQIYSHILTQLSRVFLNSGSYGFVIVLLDRETSILQSLKKFVTLSPCTLLVGGLN